MNGHDHVGQHLEERGVVYLGSGRGGLRRQPRRRAGRRLALGGCHLRRIHAPPTHAPDHGTLVRKSMLCFAHLRGVHVKDTLVLGAGTRTSERGPLRG